MGKAEKVRILLVKRGNMSDAELARRLGISPQALSRKMNKEKFTETDMTNIANILNCSWNMESREWFKMNDTGEGYDPAPPRLSTSILVRFGGFFEGASGFPKNRTRPGKKGAHRPGQRRGLLTPSLTNAPPCVTGPIDRQGRPWETAPRAMTHSPSPGP
jgi:transcriptional regulator with XRE-family HTH domain